MFFVGMVVVQVGMLTPPTQQLRFVNQTYSVSIAEHSPHGTVLVTVLARVSNDTVPVVYSLADGDDIFDIDHHRGVLYYFCCCCCCLLLLFVVIVIRVSFSSSVLFSRRQ